MRKTVIATFSDLKDRDPTYAIVDKVDLLVVRIDDEVSVNCGRCLHRGALMSDGFVRGKTLIRGVHPCDYRLDLGVSAHANDQALPKVRAWVDQNQVLVDADEIGAWAQENPQPDDRKACPGHNADPSHGAGEQPYTGLIHTHARQGPRRTGHHRVVDSIGVPRGQIQPKRPDHLEKRHGRPVGRGVWRTDIIRSTKT